ncbi:hypothetical protein ACB092_11G220000 [Castanea dentata]
MSKTLLSCIKPLHNPKPVSSSSPLPFRNFMKHVQGTIQILKTQDQWEQSLESFFSESDVVVSNFAHFVLDQIHDVELGLKFFDWASKFKVFSKIELVLERMKLEELKPTCEALSVVIQAYAEPGLVDKAVEFYYVVGEIHNCVPSVFACNSLLNNSCVDNYSTCIMEGRELIEDRWGEGCIPNVVFYNTHIDGYCNKGEFESANGLFMELKLKEFLPTLETSRRGLKVNARVYNNIIDARCKHGCTVKVVEIMGRMIESGCEPDIITYNTLINVSCEEGKVEEAYKFLEQAMKRGLMLNKQGEYYRTLDLLIKMTEGGHKPDLVSYGALIHGHIVTGEGVLPDVCIYNVLIIGLCKKGRFPTAKLLFADMLDQNVQPDAFVYATLVDGFVRDGDIQEAKILSELVTEKGIDPGVVGYNALIKGFCKFEMMKDAFSCIIRMRKGHHAPNVFTYTILIDGYVKQHDLDGALKMFGLMVKQRCKPNVVTYTALINGFCGKADTNRAKKNFKEMHSCGLEPNVVTYTILIGRFCKDCKLAKAASFFELMLMTKCTPNDVIFYYLVNGYANIALTTVLKESNELQEVEKSMFLDFFGRMLCDKMIGKGFLLDSVSFSALLHGISLEGRSKEWKNIISCTWNEHELQTAVKYSLKLNQYLPRGRSSDALLILEALIEDYKSNDQQAKILVG